MPRYVKMRKRGPIGFDPDLGVDVPLDISEKEWTTLYGVTTDGEKVKIGDIDISKEKEVKVEARVANDPVSHPLHYTNRNMECIDEMLVIFGKEAVYNFCRCNAWKYRYRADSKGKHDEDLAKSDWYIAKAKDILKSMNETDGVM